MPWYVRSSQVPLAADEVTHVLRKLLYLHPQDIDLPNASVDVVTLILGPMLLPDAPRCFREVARVLKPDGLFLTLTPGPMETHDILTEQKKRVLESGGHDVSNFSNSMWEAILNQWGEF